MIAPHEPGVANLYEKIDADIAAHDARCSEPGALTHFLSCAAVHSPSSDLDSMRWEPKSRSAGVVAEKTSDDPLLGVLSVRRVSARKLLIRFLLKTHDLGPIRCVVVLNGRHSIRIAINNGKIGRRRTTAEVVLEIDPLAGGTDQALTVEITREARLLCMRQLVPRPASLVAVVFQTLQILERALRFPLASAWGRRPVRVKAMRLLEESFRIKAK